MIEHFAITAQPAGDGGTLLCLSGEFDLDARDALRDALLERINAGSDVTVELGAVTFLDSEGLSALIEGYNAAHAAGRDLRLTGARGPVRRVLVVTGVLGFGPGA